MNKTAVVLFNLGGPSSLKEVKPFLLNLFKDPAILQLPSPFRFCLAYVITWSRLQEAQHVYSQLGGGSPLLKNTEAQAKALQSELEESYRVFVAMRYAHPLMQDVFEEIKAYNPSRVVLLPLYPQYSTTTTASSFREWRKVTRGWEKQAYFIESYPTEKGFLEALKDLTWPCYQQAQKYGTPRILLTAHGLPEKIVKKGDPYQGQVEETAEAFIKKLKISSLDYVLCYQSRVGPLKWTGPYTEDEIVKASHEKRPLVIVPLSFVSEHSETLVELDMTYRHLALQNGCPAYYRVKTVQTHPLFIKGLASLVRRVTLRF